MEPYVAGGNTSGGAC